jgi:hypothetical protein
MQMPISEVTESQRNPAEAVYDNQEHIRLRSVRGCAAHGALRSGENDEAVADSEVFRLFQLPDYPGYSLTKLKDRPNDD